MDVHRLVRFKCSIRIATLLKRSLGVRRRLGKSLKGAGERTYCIVEIPGSDRFLYGGDIRGIRIAFDHDFNPLT